MTATQHTQHEGAEPALHATFTLERTYDLPPEQVFDAWADPATKVRWFASPGADHVLDFRVGGTEVTRGGPDADAPFVFTSTYQDIQPGSRLVYSSTLAHHGTVTTVSITSVEIAANGTGSTLVLTEHGIFLDGLEEPAWREQGTAEWLDRLEGELR